ncbi:MAG: DUF2326 domain-containing protein [Ignavibacteriaceae bacterium]|jgi:uncharacterized protein YydD (DUF2326 family)|nr:DUF2326 domain-containing protein [Ignavibacteriaceae bacterium]
MKLSKLYSNKAFHNTEFNLGLNVIFADVKAKASPNSSHSIGKTKFIRLLDFLLLKKVVPKKHFLTSTKDNETNTLKFNGYEFYLELLLNSGSYLTIKRTVADSSKISLKLSESSVSGFEIPKSWDFESIGIDEAKEKLNEYLNFDFFKRNPGLDYRDTINYSLRIPDEGDYTDLFKLSKFTFDEKKWKTFMFSLLGFDSTVVAEKYIVEEEIKQKNKVIREQEEGFNINSNQKDEVEGFIQVLTKSKQEKIQELDSLNFYNQDNKIIVELVDEIETKIGELNKHSYNLQFEVKKITESLKSDFSFDFELIKEVFGEVELHFPDQLAKSYEELIEFNKQITVERKDLLKETLSKKTEELREVKISLFNLNKEKEKFRDVIQDNSIIKKLKEYQNELIGLEHEIARHEAQLDSIKIIESKKSEIDKLGDELKIAVQKLSAIIDNTSSNPKYIRVRNYFSEFARAILNYPAIISISKNSNNNVEYGYRVGETKKGDGNTYRKMLCVAFDLAILAEYSSESYFKFVYHDDVFSNQENKIRIRLLNLIKEYCTKYNIQYILSIIKDDLPRDQNDNPIMFTDEEIIMELHDRDNSGKLFKTSF